MTDNADAVIEIVRESLKRGKAIITANKKMVAEHLAELIELQRKHEVPLLYESACCASIPVIRNLEEYYDNDLSVAAEGIINGSTNYILTKIFEEKSSYATALAEAQRLGFAESDPSLDVEGHDALNKLCLLLAHAYGILAHPSKLLCHGIHRLNAIDSEVAAAQGAQIKLVARAMKQPNGQIAAFVLPQFVKPPHLSHTVRNEYNGVVLTSSLSPTSSFFMEKEREVSDGIGYFGRPLGAAL